MDVTCSSFLLATNCSVRCRSTNMLSWRNPLCSVFLQFPFLSWLSEFFHTAFQLLSTIVAMVSVSFLKNGTIMVRTKDISCLVVCWGISGVGVQEAIIVLVPTNRMLMWSVTRNIFRNLQGSPKSSPQPRRWRFEATPQQRKGQHKASLSFCSGGGAWAANVIVTKCPTFAGCYWRGPAHTHTHIHTHTAAAVQVLPRLAGADAHSCHRAHVHLTSTLTGMRWTVVVARRDVQCDWLQVVLLLGCMEKAFDVAS